MWNSDPERLRMERAALEKLRDESTIFSFTCEGEPPRRYLVTLRGTGTSRTSSARGGVEIVPLQRIEIRLPFNYPQAPPEVRWLTPIVHPNVTYGGLARLADLGLEWTSALTLEALCERLWDVSRLAYYQREHPANFAAAKWLQEQPQHALPLDVRPLRDAVVATNPNIISYAPRAGRGIVLRAADEPVEVLYIGEDTPAPPDPRRRGDDDVLYIGDE